MCYLILLRGNVKVKSNLALVHQFFTNENLKVFSDFWPGKTAECYLLQPINGTSLFILIRQQENIYFYVIHVQV